MPGELLPKFICSHVPMQIFLLYEVEKSEEIKRELFPLRGVPILVHSPEVWERNPQSHTLGCPSLRRTHSYRNLPYNIKEFGELLVLVCSPEVQGCPRAHTLGCPSLRRTNLYGNLPYNIREFM